MLKHPTRRDLLHAGGTIAGAAFIARFVDSAKADSGTHGSAPPFFSQRSVINLGFLFENDYAFINHLLQADNAFGPITYGGWFTSGPTFPALIDANGWPNNSAADNQLW